MIKATTNLQNHICFRLLLSSTGLQQWTWEKGSLYSLFSLPTHSSTHSRSECPHHRAHPWSSSRHITWASSSSWVLRGCCSPYVLSLLERHLPPLLRHQTLSVEAQQSGLSSFPYAASFSSGSSSFTAGVTETDALPWPSGSLLLHARLPRDHNQSISNTEIWSCQSPVGALQWLPSFLRMKTQVLQLSLTKI